jgi:hypothetical protein
MDDMNITAATFTANVFEGVSENTSIQATIDGIEMSVPLDPANRHYAEIMKQVANGDLVIEDAV